MTTIKIKSQGYDANAVKSLTELSLYISSFGYTNCIGLDIWAFI